MKYAFLIVVVLLVIISCRKKITPLCDGSNLTYDNGIKSIIDANCMGSGCHSSGSSNGDFTTYQGMVQVLNNGKFRDQVLEKQRMPKGSKKLSQDDINKIQCWAEINYPEK